MKQLANAADILFLRDGTIMPGRGEADIQKFAELIVLDCIQYLNNEVDRLHKYRDSLPSWGENMRYECDLFIEKCMDNVQGLKNHFGIK